MAEKTDNALKLDSSQAEMNVRNLQNEIRALQNELANLDKSSGKYASTINDLTTLQEALANIMRITRTSTEETGNSYDLLVQKIGRLSKEWSNSNDEAERNTIGTQIAEINAQLKEFGVASGNLQNAPSFEGLNSQIQQMVAALPSLAGDSDAFFQSIANNVPMLVDEISKLRSSGVGAATIIKQMVSSLFSWQTAIVVAITLLAAFGKEMVQWVSGLFDGNETLKQTRKITASFTNDLASATANVSALYNVLQTTTKGSVAYNTAQSELHELMKKNLKLTDEEIARIGDKKSTIDALTKSIQENTLAQSMMNEIDKAGEQRAEALEKPFNRLQKILTKSFGDELGKKYALQIYQGLTSGSEELENMANSKLSEIVQKASVEGINLNLSGLQNSFKKIASAQEDYEQTVRIVSEVTNSCSNELGLNTDSVYENAEAKRKAAVDTRALADAIESSNEKVKDETLRLKQSTRTETRENELLTLEENYEAEIAAFNKRVENENITQQNADNYRLALHEKYRADINAINEKYDKIEEDARQESINSERQKYEDMVASQNRELKNLDQDQEVKLTEAEVSRYDGLDPESYSNEGKQNELQRQLEEDRFQIMREYRLKRIDLLQSYLEEEESINGEGSERALELQHEIDMLSLEQQKASNEHKKNLYDADVEANEIAEKKKQEAKEKTVKIIQQSLQSISGIMGGLAEVYEEEGKTSKEAAKTAKALRIAEATINTINGAISAYMSAQSLGPIAGPIIGAINAAVVVGTGIAQISKIKAVDVENPGDGGSIGASVNPPAVIQQVPVTTTMTGASTEQRLNEMADAQNATAQNTANPQRVYVVYSDIEQAGRRVQVQTSEATF